MRQHVFLDTNVVLDLLGERLHFYDSIAKVATLADKGELQLFASALTFATVSYFLAKNESNEIMKEKLRKFKIICKISALDDLIIEKGLNSKFKDFEDSLQYFSALQSDCQVILTRNAKDFKHTTISVMNAEEFLRSLKRN